MFEEFTDEYEEIHNYIEIQDDLYPFFEAKQDFLKSGNVSLCDEDEDDGRQPHEKESIYHITEDPQVKKMLWDLITPELTYDKYLEIPEVKNILDTLIEPTFTDRLYKQILPRWLKAWNKHTWYRTKAAEWFDIRTFSETPAFNFLLRWQIMCNHGYAPRVDTPPEYWEQLISGEATKDPTPAHILDTHDRIWKHPIGDSFPAPHRIHCLSCYHMIDTPCNHYCKKFPHAGKPDAIYFQNAPCLHFSRCTDQMIEKRLKYAILDEPFAPRADVNPPPNWQEANKKHLMGEFSKKFGLVDYSKEIDPEFYYAFFERKLTKKIKTTIHELVNSINQAYIRPIAPPLRESLPKKIIDHITHAITQVELPESMVFFRGGLTKELQRAIHWDGMLFEADIDDFNTRYGDRLIFSASDFVSCTTHRDTEGFKNAYVVFHIRVPKYAHALYLEPLKETLYPREATSSQALPPEPEILLPPNSRFLIRQFSRHEGTLHIMVDLIDDGDHAWENGQAIGRLVDGKLYYSRSAAKSAMDKLNQSKAEN